MKKLLTGILLAVLVFALAACGAKNDSGDKNASGEDKAAKKLLKKRKLSLVHQIHRTQSF